MPVADNDTHLFDMFGHRSVFMPTVKTTPHDNCKSESEHKIGELGVTS